MNNGGVVTFGFNGTITLTNTIQVTNDVILDATGRSVVISGGNSVGLFYVNPDVTFAATNLVMANGAIVGTNGANGTYGTAAQNGAPGQGGAIFNNGGTVQLTLCTLESNSVTGGMGGSTSQGIYANIFAVGGNGQGGAIYVNGGSLFLNSVSLFENSANGGAPTLATMNNFEMGIPGGDGLGGAVYTTNATVLLLNCNLSSNTCTGPASPGSTSAFGGAIFLASGSLVISNSIISSNTAVGGNAPANQTDDGDAPASAYGGAIAALSGTAMVVLCQISSNAANGGQGFENSGTGEAQGGAIYSSGTLVASNTAFSGNQAVSGSGSSFNTDGRGGAIYNLGSASLTGCTVSSNLAQGGTAGDFGVPNPEFPGGNGLGGGICNFSQLAMTNCTVALNTALAGNGSHDGMPGSSFGGGVFNTNGVLTTMNVTIASNFVILVKAPMGPYGIATGANVANLTGTISMENSLLAYPVGSTNAYGPVTDAGYNVSSDGSANFESGTSYNFTDPLLLPLANNGGPTLTMALSSDSPAVDSGTAVGAPSTDQRGFPRPSGSGVDMGAYELQQNALQSPTLALAWAQQTLQLSFQGQSNVSYILQGSSTLTNWSQIQVIGPLTNNAQVSLTVTNNGQSNEFFRLIVQ